MRNGNDGTLIRINAAANAVANDGNREVSYTIKYLGMYLQLVIVVTII